MSLRWTDRIENIPPDAWDALLSASFRPSPFMSRLFLLPWARAFASGKPLRIGRWAGEGGAEGLLFLVRGEGGGWELMGGEQTADSLDALVPEGREAAFWAEVLGRGDEILGEGPLVLPSLVEGSPALAVLPTLCRETGFVFRAQETDRAPYIPLPDSFEGYLGRLGSRERHELRRKMRRAAAAIQGLAVREARSPVDLARDFPAFVDLHRKSHPEKREFMDDRMAGFFGEVAERLLGAGLLRLAVLSGGAGDAAAAFQIAWNGSLLLYNSGFDPAVREASPGVVLLARCIEGAIRDGMREYDFLRGRERYKYDLGGRDRVVYRATVSRP